MTLVSCLAGSCPPLAPYTAVRRLWVVAQGCWPVSIRLCGGRIGFAGRLSNTMSFVHRRIFSHSVKGRLVYSASAALQNLTGSCRCSEGGFIGGLTAGADCKGGICSLSSEGSPCFCFWVFVLLVDSFSNSMFQVLLEARTNCLLGDKERFIVGPLMSSANTTLPGLLLPLLKNRGMMLDKRRIGAPCVAFATFVASCSTLWRLPRRPVTQPMIRGWRAALSVSFCVDGQVLSYLSLRVTETSRMLWLWTVG